MRSGTSWAAVPFVPEIRLLTAAEPFGLWDLTERDAPPFWAFPWAGGQALARYVLDHPEIVRGRRVLDAASGSGLVAIAAAKAGAASVTACDVDPNAVAAIGINAHANDAAAVAARVLDLAADDPSGAQVVLAADVFYQRELARARRCGFLRGAARSGAEVFVADPGRAFLPASALTSLASYEVPVLAVLEDKPVKTVTVYRLGLEECMGCYAPSGVLNDPSSMQTRTSSCGLSTAAAAGRRCAAPGTAPRRPPRPAGSSRRRPGRCRTPVRRGRTGSTRR